MNHLSCIRVIPFLLLPFFMGCGGPEEPTSVEEVKAFRQELDETVFADEIDAQAHEKIFSGLWDRMLQEDPFDVLAEQSFKKLNLAKAIVTEERSWGIEGIVRATLSGEPELLDHSDYVERLAQLKTAGWKIRQTEWHHAQFIPAGEGQPPRSVINVEIHAENELQNKRVILRGPLNVSWSRQKREDGLPAIEELDAQGIEQLGRTGKVSFKRLQVIDPKQIAPKRYPRISPLLVQDMDGDGLSEIILGGCNVLLKNRGGASYAVQDFLQHGLVHMAEPGILADFNGDGRSDFIGLSQTDLRLHLFTADADGKFTQPPTICFDQTFTYPHVLTAGDLDHDGDLDLFVGQWKPPYQKGSMPTPYWNANDGYPDFLLRNDGNGRFTDITESAGLAEKRLRRTYSASLVDLNDDHHLDLLVVSDFAGLDLYLNDGRGHFNEATDELVDERLSFGMAHTMNDFDGDGNLDFYMIGMSSTTARRLQALNVHLPGHESDAKYRIQMGYGNRMYLARSRQYAQPSFRDQVARTGWSWGCTSADFDNDGDADIYVANGHLSGRSTQDYCSRFWCHDVYQGNSNPDPILDKFYQVELMSKLGHQISWNGYEHNVLYLNGDGQAFMNAAFLLGTAFEFDSRAVVGDDIDGDGRVDILVVEYSAATFQQRLHILRNQVETSGQWIGVRLQNSKQGGSPIGARVTVKAGDQTWTRRVVTGDSFTAQHPTTAHVGLGSVDAVDELIVRWQNGMSKRLANPSLGVYHTLSAEE